MCCAAQTCNITSADFPPSVVRGDGDGDGACPNGDIELKAAGQASEQKCALKCNTGYTPTQQGSAIEVSCNPKATSSTSGETTWPSDACEGT